MPGVARGEPPLYIPPHSQLEFSNRARPMIDLPTARRLLERARDVRDRAYAPYSGFQVGAALLDAAGGIHVGANVENSSYGLTTCAERSALSAAVSSGAREFGAIAIAGPNAGEVCPPCGSCRQILHEFGGSLAVITEQADGSPQVQRLGDLLPGAFDASRLPAARAAAASE